MYCNFKTFYLYVNAMEKIEIRTVGNFCYAVMLKKWL